jgi:restriction endonuclease S subunit
MASNWPTAKLGDVIDLFDSQRVPLNSRQRQERQGKFPYYGAQGIIDHIDGYIFDGRYILVAEDGENLNSKKLPFALFATGKFWVNNHAHILRGKPGIADDTFLLACLNYADIKPLVTGAAQPKLSQGNLRLIEIPLPPLPVQQRIAGILSAYDELIENSQRRIKILESMARALYREWFVHFRFPGHEYHPRVAFPLGEIPQRWEVKELATVCADGKGIQTGPFGSQLHESDYSHEGVPVVMPKDLIGFRIRPDTIARIPEATAEKLSRHRMQPGDIVYGRRGDIGRRAFVMPHQVGWFCGTGCLRIRPNPQAVNGWYLFNHLGQDDVVGVIKGRAQGVTMPNLNTGVLLSVPLRLPPRELQDDFARLTFPTAEMHESLSAKIENLRRTRDLLLPRLLSRQVELAKSNGKEAGL